MYDALTPLFDQVTSEDLMTKFKSEGFGVGPDGPGRQETVPRAGVTIVRDRFNVPHITGQSRDDVTWAMGWVLQQDRGLLLAQARDAAKLAAIDAPNVYAFGLVINLRQYTPTPAVDRMIERDGLRALRGAGARGQGRAARRRRLPAGRQRAAEGGGLCRQAVAARGHLRRQRHHRRDLRRGRRRRGAPLGVPLLAAQASTAPHAGTGCSTTSASSTIATRRRR